MINVEDKSNCCGCRACEQVCPTNAISMQEDNEGFIYPIVDEKKCINCSICDKTCPYNNLDSKEAKPIALAAWSLDESNRLESSSGGSFTEFAKYILSLNGVVCGAGFDDKLNVVHKFIENEKDLFELKGSKYVKSNVGNTYAKTKEYLENSTIVLYTGTPCQIAGLKHYLKKDYKNLYTLDLICHGVPSPKVYKKYINELEEKEKSPAKNILFRDKTFGWKTFSMKIKFKNKKIYTKKLTSDNFMRGFLSNLYLMPSCYSCIFAKLDRDSDITLGDFWGVGVKYPELDDDKGTSLLLVNSKKGKELIDSCRDYLFVKECDLEYAIKNNTCIITPVKYNKKRVDFFENLDKLEFDKLIKKYVPKNSILRRVYYKVLRIASRVKGMFFRTK